MSLNLVLFMTKWINWPIKFLWKIILLTEIENAIIKENITLFNIDFLFQESLNIQLIVQMRWIWIYFQETLGLNYFFIALFFQNHNLIFNGVNECAIKEFFRWLNSSKVCLSYKYCINKSIFVKYNINYIKLHNKKSYFMM